MIKLELKNHNAILTVKQQKYHYYHQVNFMNTNNLQVKKY